MTKMPAGSLVDTEMLFKLGGGGAMISSIVSEIAFWGLSRMEVHDMLVRFARLVVLLGLCGSAGTHPVLAAEAQQVSPRSGGQSRG